MQGFLKFLILFLLVAACKTNSSATDDGTSNPPPPPPPPPPPTMGSLEEELVFLFNEASGGSTSEEETNGDFSIDDGAGQSEWISGVEGSALRINGYYGWAQGNINKALPTESVAISGWIAPAVFPVQRKDEDPIEENTVAALFSNFNEAQNRGVELGVNHHGRAIGRFSIDEEVFEILSDDEIPLNQWSFLTLNIDAENGSASLFVDGVLAKNSSFGAGNISWVDNGIAYLGRGGKNKSFINYRTNGLTGAIDGVVVWNRNMTNEEVQATFTMITPGTPDLTIPIESRFADDIHRPKYHLLPSASWSNESHGAFYLDGTYHIFSQRNFSGPYLQHINWGHFVSNDLLSWEEKPQILWPQPGFDEVGVWSGHAYVDNGEPIIFYTGVNKARAGIGVATSTPPYENWTKSAENPVVPTAPSSVAAADFRDPYVFDFNGTKYMMVGTGLRSGTSRGGLFLYRANNTEMTSWQYLGTMFEGNPPVDNTGDFWEMPLYWDFGEKSILLINKLPNANALYWTGDFDGSQFVADQTIPQSLDPINQLLSPTIFPDENGNLTAIGIIPDEVSATKHFQQGWANVFSLPRVWEYSNGKILQRPHPSVNNLRGPSQSFSNIDFDGTSTFYLGGASGTQYEIEATIDPGTANRVGFVLNRGAGGGEQTLIYYNISANQFVVERANSSNLSDVPKGNQTGIYNLPDGPLNWRVFVDASVIEVFVNDEVAFTTRVFPSAGSNEIDLYAEGGTATATDVTIYNVEGGGTSSTAKNRIVKPSIKVTAFPNPSAREFNLQVDTPIEKPTSVVLYVFDVLGNPKKGIYTYLNAGSGTIVWNGHFDNGQKAPPGVYLVKGFVGNELVGTKLIVK